MLPRVCQGRTLCFYHSWGMASSVWPHIIWGILTAFRLFIFCTGEDRADPLAAAVHCKKGKCWDLCSQSKGKEWWILQNSVYGNRVGKEEGEINFPFFMSNSFSFTGENWGRKQWRSLKIRSSEFLSFGNDNKLLQSESVKTLPVQEPIGLFNEKGALFCISEASSSVNGMSQTVPESESQTLAPSAPWYSFEHYAKWSRSVQLDGVGVVIVATLPRNRDCTALRYTCSAVSTLFSWTVSRSH